MTRRTKPTTQRIVKGVAMTPTEFRAWRATMQWTQHELANRLGVARNSVSRYEVGTRTISAQIASHVRMLTRSP